MSGNTHDPRTIFGSNADTLSEAERLEIARNWLDGAGKGGHSFYNDPATAKFLAEQGQGEESSARVTPEPTAM